MAILPNEYNRLIGELAKLTSQFQVPAPTNYVTIGTGPELFIPASNNRWGFLILNVNGGNITINWSNVFLFVNEGIPVTGFTAFPLLFKFSDYGPLVQYEWYLNSGGIANVNVTWAPILLV